MGRHRGIIVILFTISMMSASLWIVQPARAPEAVFTFAAAGDIGNFWRQSTSGNFLTAIQAGLDSLNSSNPDFFLALGDLSYDALEQSWCDTWLTGAGNPSGKSFPRIQLLSGNHESGERPLSEDGNINLFLQHCGFGALGSDSFTSGPDKGLIPDNRTAGCAWALTSPAIKCYGKEYYFDWPLPPATPVARFVMITPATTWNSTVDSARRWRYDNVIADPPTHYQWTRDAIRGARTAGIPWVIVGMHKNFIEIGRDDVASGNEIGADIFNMLVSERVDLILQAHNHNYQRTGQLQNGLANCLRINATAFSPSCVVASPSSSLFLKGRGTVLNIVGTFGRNLYPLNATESDAGYFQAWNSTTHGYLNVEVGNEFLRATFVPTDGTFIDSYTIDREMQADFTFSPISSIAGTPVTFTPTIAGGTSSHVCTWDFGDGHPGETTDCTVQVSRSYQAAGSYAATLSAEDAFQQKVVRTRIVQVVDFSLSPSSSGLTIYNGSSQSSTISVSGFNGFTGTVSLSAYSSSASVVCGLDPPAVTLGVSETSTLNCEGRSPGVSTVTVNGTIGSASRTTTVTVTVQDFTVSVYPAEITMEVASSRTSSITMTSLQGFQGLLNLQQTVDRSDATVSLNATTITLAPDQASTVTLTVSSTIPGRFVVEVRIWREGISHSATVFVTVQDTIEPLIAIDSPSDGSVLTSASVTVSGTASDNLELQKVEVSNDGITWFAATGTTSWSATLTLNLGLNTIYVRATDIYGNTEVVEIAVTVQTPQTAPARDPFIEFLRSNLLWLVLAAIGLSAGVGVLIARWKGKSVRSFVSRARVRSTL